MGVWGDVERLATLARRAFATGFTHEDLRIQEYEVMAAAPTPRTPTELARTLLVSPGAMTDRIDRLVARGWVERQPDPDDGRSVRIAVTPAGQAVLEQANRDIELARARLLATLTPTEEHTLEKLLQKLLASLEN